jgi:hypothetical protein
MCLYMYKYVFMYTYEYIYTNYEYVKMYVYLYRRESILAIFVFPRHSKIMLDRIFGVLQSCEKLENF